MADPSTAANASQTASPKTSYFETTAADADTLATLFIYGLIVWAIILSLLYLVVTSKSEQTRERRRNHVLPDISALTFFIGVYFSLSVVLVNYFHALPFFIGNKLGLYGVSIGIPIAAIFLLYFPYRALYGAASGIQLKRPPRPIDDQFDAVRYGVELVGTQVSKLISKKRAVDDSVVGTLARIVVALEKLKPSSSTAHPKIALLLSSDSSFAAVNSGSRGFPLHTLFYTYIQKYWISRYWAEESAASDRYLLRQPDPAQDAATVTLTNCCNDSISAAVEFLRRGVAENFAILQEHAMFGEPKNKFIRRPRGCRVWFCDTETTASQFIDIPHDERKTLFDNFIHIQGPAEQPEAQKGLVNILVDNAYRLRVSEAARSLASGDAAEISRCKLDEDFRGLAAAVALVEQLKICLKGLNSVYGSRVEFRWNDLVVPRLQRFLAAAESHQYESSDFLAVGDLLYASGPPGLDAKPPEARDENDASAQHLGQLFFGLVLAIAAAAHAKSLPLFWFVDAMSKATEDDRQKAYRWVKPEGARISTSGWSQFYAKGL